ncbi:hypothetical protein [Methylobacterium organophilum]|uniref:Rad50/SbcC-type AAA domain-containing protein n=1 Tax=Methylobacterium organophilum TaxID=410 RepID=A0ABQ4TB08_METOR|nr:hypothetical protein [Methylobacterium organophilum]GJE27531.1 hypothetical protein LKMONMHP_2391 [Methylobacterium organophilum]
MMSGDGAQDGPDALLAAIAGKCGRSVEDTRSVLTRHGVGITRSLAVPKRLCLRSLRFSGEKKGGKAAGTIAFNWPEIGPGIWGITSGRNLRGKSTVLGIIRWCLTGKRSGIPAEMAEWFAAVRLTFTLDNELYEVEIADAVAVRGTLWRGVDDARRAQATFGSEDGFKAAMSDLFMMQLGLSPLVTHTVRPTGESLDQPHDWAFFAGAMSIDPNPEYLFGTVAMSALPTRMMQMFLGIPWTSTNADLVAAKGRLRNQATQNRAFAKGVAERRKDRIEALGKAVAAAEAELRTLHTPAADRAALAVANQAYAELEARRRAAEAKLAAVEADVAAASEAAAHAGRLLQDFTDDRAAGMVFRALEPVCCPRCDEVFAEDRRAATRDEQTCVVCRTVEAPEQDPSEAEERLRAAADLAAGELSYQRTLLRLAREALGSAETASKDAEKVCAGIEARLAAPSRRTELEAELIGNKARLEELDAEGEVSSGQDDDGSVIEAALAVVEDAFKPLQESVLKEVSGLILEYAVLFGVENLEETKLSGNTTLRLVKAGVRTSFGSQTAGERARLKIAATLAIITVAERRGVGRHPGLLLIDSPGANEMVAQDYDKLVAGLAGLPAEFRHLQVFVAAVESPTIREHIPERHRKRAVGDDYLW